MTNQLIFHYFKLLNKTSYMSRYKKTHISLILEFVNPFICWCHNPLFTVSLASSLAHHSSITMEFYPDQDSPLTQYMDPLPSSELLDRLPLPTTTRLTSKCSHLAQGCIMILASFLAYHLSITHLWLLKVKIHIFHEDHCYILPSWSHNYFM